MALDHLQWSGQQEAAIKSVRSWLNGGRGQIFRLFGFAGTGKTTLAKELAGDIRGRVLYGAFTGKAALVMRRKGCDGASTIHSLIYSLDEDNKGWEPKFILNENSVVADADLVIIDECSMVDEELARDLLSFRTKVLVLGDPAQLPPVKGTGFFTECQPDFMLTEVHRQARDNPIIRLSMQIREGERLRHGDYGACRVIPRADITPDDILKCDQVLVGRNKTRQQYNRRIRELLGRESDKPEVGDKLVCLKNDREKKLLNGSLWKIDGKIKAASDLVKFQIVPEDVQDEPKPTSVKVRREFFNGTDDQLHYSELKGSDQFTYGYALTCHKAQGSQWDNVVVFDEADVFREDARRWRYTAVTRAAERLTIVGGAA